MSLQLVHDALGLCSGLLVGFSLSMVGGGGSILAVPLMIYVVGVPSAHIAIGTSAVPSPPMRQPISCCTRACGR